MYEFVSFVSKYKILIYNLKFFINFLLWILRLESYLKNCKNVKYHRHYKVDRVYDDII